MAPLVRLDRQDGVAWLTLDRPDVRNALSYDTLGELAAHVATLADDRDTRVVCVTGSGEKAFCAGADLKERKTFTEEQTVAFVRRIGETFEALALLPQPTIAALNGVAFGGGLELALACDLRVAVEGSSMGLTETALAIIPGAGGTQRLPAVVGVARAKELILGARRVGAEEALAMGLLNRVVPAAELRTATEELAAGIAANGPLAVQAAKRAVDLSASGQPLAERLVAERELYLQRVLPSKDRLEALAAFQEKRPPRFRGE